MRLFHSILVALLFLAIINSSRGDWPMFGGSPNRGKVYIGADDDTVYVFAHGKKKELLAENYMPGHVRNVVTANRGIVYVIAGRWLFAIAQPKQKAKPRNKKQLQSPKKSNPPKYNANITRLYHARKHIQRQPAADYWALMPYYAGQPNDSTCSTATAAMVLNALRAERALHQNDKLITQDDLLAKVPRALWQDKVKHGGSGVSLAEMSRLLPVAAQAYKMDVRADVVHFAAKTPDALGKLRQFLEANERSANDIIIVNFLQSGLTGDPDGAVGHFAPVAAYDAQRRRALIFDPDRKWYEPYWVSDERLLAAMATRDADAKQFRGLIRVTLK